MKIHRGNFESNLAFLEQVPELKTPKKILEIGSGRGGMMHELLRLGHFVVGTEINPEYIAKAKQEYNIDLVPLQTETPALPFADESFDVVVSFDVFEHIPDSGKHVAEVRRVLKPGGCYLLGTPNKWTNIPFEIIKEKSFTKYQEYHVALHTCWGLQRRFRQAGFTVQFIEVPLVNDFFVNKVRTYLGSFGVGLVKILKPDSWPRCLKPNFYVVATKSREQRAVSNEQRAVSNEQRTVSNEQRTVSNEQRTVSNEQRTVSREQ